MDPFAVQSVGFATAFAGGILSFISPCILPIIPSFMFFISGTSAGAMQNEGEGDTQEATAADVQMAKSRARRQTILSALCFILGFSLVFVALGAGATYLGSFLRDHQDLLRKIGGVVIILLGLHMSGLLEIRALLYEKRMHFKARPPGYLGALLIGIAFALGWTPCIGPILGAILAVASTKAQVSEGMLLLSAYSLGLAIPFFITALLMDKIFVHFRKIQKYMPKISLASGIFLMVVGVMIFTNALQSVSNYLFEVL